MRAIKQFLITAAVAMALYACSPANGDFPGSEYMPDMGHSVAVEANTYNYYHYNTWDEASTVTLQELVRNPWLPVKGTVARGFAGGQLGAAATMDVVLGNDMMNGIRIAPNGSVPYYYADTDSARLLATAQILDNPFPITANGLERGKELYTIFCGVCHGEKGLGDGYIWNTETNPKAKYPAKPANLVSEEFVAASNGRFYHALIYGKNVMGGYADKLSYEERWQVIHYVRSLQAAATSTVYDDQQNTLNSAFGIPAALYQQPVVVPSAAPAVDAEHGDAPGHTTDAAHAPGSSH